MITAVAVDSDGARVTSVAAAVWLLRARPPHLRARRPPPSGTTGPPPSPGTPPPGVWRLVFSPSLDHNLTVDCYRLEVYASSPRQLVFSQDLGKPAVVAGDCTVDISQPVSALARGLYEAVVRAVDDGTGLSSLGATVAFSR